MDSKLHLVGKVHQIKSRQWMVTRRIFRSTVRREVLGLILQFRVAVRSCSSKQPIWRRGFYTKYWGLNCNYWLQRKFFEKGYENRISFGSFQCILNKVESKYGCSSLKNDDFVSFSLIYVVQLLFLSTFL